MEIPVVEKFFALVDQFIPFHDGSDLYWSFFMRIKNKWKKIFIRKYQDIYYVDATGWDSFSYPAEYLNQDLVEEIKIWIEQLFAFKTLVLKNPIEAQAKLFLAIPIELRKGLITRKNMQHLMPEWTINLNITKSDKKILMEILRSFDTDTLDTLNADQYFEYCKVAYLANPKTFPGIEKGLSGKDYYKKYADGRDGGLLSLDGTNVEDLKKWYHSRDWLGAHPWEIYRGGNSTHIDLFIRYEYEKWSIVLNAFSSTRMAETCRIAIALKKAKLPFTLFNKESYLNRILEEDWVGIVPQDSGIKYAYQMFPDKYGVADCIHASWFFEDCPKEKRPLIKKQLKKLVFWLPERISAYLVDSSKN